MIQRMKWQFWACAAVCLLALLPLAWSASIGPNPVTGDLPVLDSAYSTVGHGSLATSGTTVLCLTGTAATSVPCSKLLLSCTAAGCLLSSSTAAATVPLPANQPLLLPVSDANKVYVSGGTNTVGYMYFR